MEEDEWQKKASDADKLLFEGIKGGNLDKVKLALDKGANINTKSKSGLSTFQYAINCKKYRANGLSNETSAEEIIELLDKKRAEGTLKGLAFTKKVILKTVLGIILFLIMAVLFYNESQYFSSMPLTNKILVLISGFLLLISMLSLIIGLYFIAIVGIAALHDKHTRSSMMAGIKVHAIAAILGTAKSSIVAFIPFMVFWILLTYFIH